MHRKMQANEPRGLRMREMLRTKKMLRTRMVRGEHAGI